jgi:DNA-binding transcriptional LysR family regulator
VVNFTQLRAFYQTAKFMSFSAAARHLFVSQPAITKQVKSFEQYLGLRLFVRKGAKLALTEEGKVIFQHAQHVFNYEKTLEEVIDRITTLKQGSLQLGTARTYARYFLPHLISVYHSHYPRIEIDLDEGSSRDVLENLLDFKNQIVIVADVENRPQIEFITLCRDQVVLIVSADHRLADKTSISVQELSHEPIIMREPGSGTRDLVMCLFSKYDVAPNVVMETGDVEMIKLLVQHGEGVAFTLKVALSSEPLDGRLRVVPLQCPPLFLDVRAVYLAKSFLSPAARAFLGILEDFVDREGVLNSMEEFIVKVYDSRQYSSDHAVRPEGEIQSI